MKLARELDQIVPSPQSIAKISSLKLIILLTRTNGTGTFIVQIKLKSSYGNAYIIVSPVEPAYTKLAWTLTPLAPHAD